MSPAASLKQFLGQASASATTGSASSRFDIHHLHRLVGMEQQEIGHMTADPAGQPCAQQERLRGDRHGAAVTTRLAVTCRSGRTRTVRPPCKRSDTDGTRSRSPSASRVPGTRVIVRNLLRTGRYPRHGPAAGNDTPGLAAGQQR